MSIQINNLDSLDFLSDNLQDISESEAAQVSGGASSTFSETYKYSAVFSSDGTGKIEESFSDGSFSSFKTIIFNADGTTDTFGGAASPAVRGISTPRG